MKALVCFGFYSVAGAAWWPTYGASLAWFFHLRFSQKVCTFLRSENRARCFFVIMCNPTDHSCGFVLVMSEEKWYASRSNFFIDPPQAFSLVLFYFYVPESNRKLSRCGSHYNDLCIEVTCLIQFIFISMSPTKIAEKHNLKTQTQPTFETMLKRTWLQKEPVSAIHYDMNNWYH